MNRSERRDAVRQPYSGPIWFRAAEEEGFRQGWLVEQSACGLAFLTRGPSTPLPGVRLITSAVDPQEDSSSLCEALVSRVERVLGDLSLVAVQIKPLERAGVNESNGAVMIS